MVSFLVAGEARAGLFDFGRDPLRLKRIKVPGPGLEKFDEHSVTVQGGRVLFGRVVILGIAVRGRLPDGIFLLGDWLVDVGAGRRTKSSRVLRMEPVAIPLLVGARAPATVTLFRPIYHAPADVSRVVLNERARIDFADPNGPFPLRIFIAESDSLHRGILDGLSRFVGHRARGNRLS